MSKTRFIPRLMDVPKGYRKEFKFYDAGVPANGSRVKFSLAITVTHEGVEMVEEGEPTAKTSSMALDWIQESIESVRRELGI